MKMKTFIAPKESGLVDSRMGFFYRKVGRSIELMHEMASDAALYCYVWQSANGSIQLGASLGSIIDPFVSEFKVLGMDKIKDLCPHLSAMLLNDKHPLEPRLVRTADPSDNNYVWICSLYIPIGEFSISPIQRICQLYETTVFQEASGRLIDPIFAMMQTELTDERMDIIKQRKENQATSRVIGGIVKGLVKTALLGFFFDAVGDTVFGDHDNSGGFGMGDGMALGTSFEQPDLFQQFT